MKTLMIPGAREPVYSVRSMPAMGGASNGADTVTRGSDSMDTATRNEHGHAGGAPRPAASPTAPS